ncbi:MAG: AbrB/MazE/SpoVT family DNA-binding domain-containing protein [Gammaproteobacteria bacterium]
MAHRTTIVEPEVVETHGLQLGNRGRLVLPAKVRRRLKLRQGDRMVLIVHSDGSLRLASLRDQVKKVQGMFSHLNAGGSLVDELIRERREEARRENEE